MVTVEANLYSPSPELRDRSEIYRPNHETYINKALDQLRIEYKGYTLYKAGLPGYARPFLRDMAKASRIFADPEMIANSLNFASALQAKEADPNSGAEPAKIFHEYDIDLQDGIELSEKPGKNTLFNSCDSNAEYLKSHEEYISLTGDFSLLRAHKQSIEDAAVRYVRSHINGNNLFEEDPRFCGADSFALKVTFWKDSVLPGRENGEPKYPVVYPFAHIQNAAALRSAGRILNRPDLLDQADKMVKALPGLFDSNLNSFFIAVDSQGPVRGITSDSLHALSYLEPGDLPSDILDRIIRSSEALETEIGYLTLDPASAEGVEDDYHTKTVWSHEQAEIHKGAKKHFEWAIGNSYKNLAEGLMHVMNVSRRPSDYYDQNPGSFPEAFLVNGSIRPSGCNPQLWSVAAADYFLRQVA